MPRKRRMNESIKVYHSHLKEEKVALKIRLRGVVLWPGEWGPARSRLFNGTPHYYNGQHLVNIDPRRNSSVLRRLLNDG